MRRTPAADTSATRVPMAGRLTWFSRAGMLSQAHLKGEPMKRTIALVVGASMVMTACAGSTKVRTVVSTVPGPTVTKTVTKTVAPPPSATPSSASDTLKVGQTWAGDGATTTVTTFRKDAAPDAPAPAAGQSWDAADVKVCVTETGYVSTQPWALTGSDSGIYKPAGEVYNQFPEPEYPFLDTVLKAGTCASGWIVFAVPDSATPAQVRYSLPVEANAQPVLVTWSI